jgi:hypothetical protein
MDPFAVLGYDVNFPYSPTHPGTVHPNAPLSPGDAPKTFLAVVELLRCDN